MVRALRIPADQDEPITALEVHQLEDYQAAVGGWIEPVDIPELGITIYVHEEGLVLGLPLNPRATFLWWYFVPEARQKAMLVGPALIVGLPDRSGDSMSIPNDVARLLTEPGRWRVEAKVKGEKDWMQIPTTHTDYFEALVWPWSRLNDGGTQNTSASFPWAAASPSSRSAPPTWSTWNTHPPPDGLRHTHHRGGDCPDLEHHEYSVRRGRRLFHVLLAVTLYGPMDKTGHSRANAVSVRAATVRK